LIDSDGSQRGAFQTDDAINLARDKNLDLVEISPNTDPPVCKIMDFGKFQYEKQKKEKLNKKNQHVIHVKEIRLRPHTGDHDLITKLTKGQKFLAKGDKLKITIMFRGREMARKDIGIDMLNRVVDILKDYAHIDKEITEEGRRISVILSPAYKGG
jgi:translation initiation factor IF-3